MFIFTILYINITTAVPVVITEQNLTDSFKNVITQRASKFGFNVSNVSVSNNTINITVNNSNYTLNYNLESKPTFTMEIPIQKGLSYSDFIDKTDKLILPVLGYVAVADIQGVSFDVIKSNALSLYLDSKLNGDFSLSGKSSYTIIDDLADSTIVKGNDTKTIYTSDFAEKIMEYVNDAYQNKQTMSDPNGTFTWIIEKKKDQHIHPVKLYLQ